MTATVDDSVTGNWLGSDPTRIALIHENGVTVAILATVGTEFATLWVQFFNRSSSSMTIDPLVIALLDDQRIELTRLRPDQVATRIASNMAAPPTFQPKYLITTETTGTVNMTSPSAANVSASSQTVVQRDPTQAAVQGFAEGFTAGYNRSILRAAQAAYDDGFVTAMILQPNSGKRGRLYFARPIGRADRLHLRIGGSKEYELAFIASK